MNYDSQSTVRRRTAAALIALTACAGFLSPVGVAHATTATDPLEKSNSLVGSDQLAQPAPLAATDQLAEFDNDVSAAWDSVIRIDITPSRIALSEGKLLDIHGVVSHLNPTVDSKTYEAVAVRSGGAEVDAIFAYRISMLNKPTPFWVQMQVDNYGYRTACIIYFGDPSAGGEPAATAPFSCKGVRHWDSTYNLRYGFDVWLNREAEASGTITPRELSLAGGTFRSDLPYHVSGQSELAPRQSTNFDTVLREGDFSVFDKQARTEFAYQIIEDDGKPTGLWAAGMVTNHRGWDRFSADARCGIYKFNPLAGNGWFDWAEPIESDRFYCKTTGGVVSGPEESGNGHYHANFTVGRP